jgi:hypothetical protein
MRLCLELITYGWWKCRNISENVLRTEALRDGRNAEIRISEDVFRTGDIEVVEI